MRTRYLHGRPSGGCNTVPIEKGTETIYGLTTPRLLSQRCNTVPIEKGTETRIAPRLPPLMAGDATPSPSRRGLKHLPIP